MFEDLDKKATQASFGGLVGIARQGVGDLVTRGILKDGGTYRDWLLTYCARLREHAAGRATNKPAEAIEAELAAEKLRLTTAQANKTEHEAEKERLQVEVLSKSLIPSEEVEKEWTEVLARVRAKLLTIPSKGASLVIAANSRIEAEGILKSLVWEALDELAKGGGADESSEESEPESPRDPEPATEPDSKPVGRRKPASKPGGKRRTRKVSK